MGSVRDMQHRKNLRQDVSWVQSAIRNARELIFGHGFGVNSSRVESLLKPFSLQANRVRVM